ncbi:hypothetical protein Aple_072440 [Acrocarpospora pleiomorpha]|uniref:DUF2690 domain-containing protein n=1 Tax=Acrocarpospora pleiomorpha TaxID=90975 RepID=A0A5M3XSZ3_9ACTN|nr:DUF2690 domain-containing protein [Acrocarpospora pleiomorpha]GES24345.1 hypothetical protein Aple_072440 [Acrocarpospora pleiomorpha]
MLKRLARHGRAGVLVAALAVLLGTSFTTTGATAATVSGTMDGPEASAAVDASGRTPFTLPHRVYVREDGSVDTIADPKAVAALRSAALEEGGCGYACDGKDPNSYVWNGSTCNDAVTVMRHDVENRYAELRYSSRCATAWTRTCCYVRAGGFGYAANGTQRSFVYNSQGVYFGSPVWTAMLYDAGSLTYKACLDRILAGSGHDWACTGRF